MMPFSHLILCYSLFFLPSILPRIRVFSNESVLQIRWPKCWSFTFSNSPSNEYSGLISFSRSLGWSLHYQMANIETRLIIFIAAKDGKPLYSQQKQDQELTLAQIMNSLLPNSDLNWKVGKNPRPFRYDLNQIPFEYTVEVTNRFKGFDLIECLNNYGWRLRTLYRRQWQDHPQEKEMQKGQNGCLGRPCK